MEPAVAAEKISSEVIAAQLDRLMGEQRAVREEQGALRDFVAVLFATM